MTNMFKKADQLKKVFGALVLAGMGTTLALAQNPQLQLETITAAPGETAQVRLSLEGAAADTKAVNFTVRISAEDAALLGEGPIEGILPASLSTQGYVYEDNMPVTGDNSVEYRGVIYPRDSTSPAFDATNSTTLATLSIPVAPDSGDSTDPDGIALTLVNEFASDGITGLVGISNAAGESVVSAPESPSAGAQRNIAKVDGQIVIEQAGTIVDFKGGLPSGWEAVQVIPRFGMILPDRQIQNPELDFAAVQGSGIEATLNQTGSFGFLQTGPSAQITDGLSGDMILAHKWSASTNATDAQANADLRFRMNVDGFSQQAEYIEARTAASGEQGVTTLPVASDGIVEFGSMSHLPASVANGFRDNALLALDFLTFIQGQAGTTLTLDNAEYDIIDPSSLQNEAMVWSHDFNPNADGTDGFTFLPDRGAFLGDSQGIETSQITDSGMGVMLGGPPRPDGQFSFAIWEGFVNEWQLNADKIYRVDYNVATTAAQPLDTNIARLRINFGELAEQGIFDFVHMAVIESGGDATDPAGLPDQDGESYTTWINAPDALAGQTALVSFDGYQTTDRTSGGVILQNITVRSYDRPDFLSP